MTAHAHPLPIKPASKRDQARAYYPHALAFRIILAAIVTLAILCATAALCFANESQRRNSRPSDPPAAPAWTITDHQLPATALEPGSCANGNCQPQAAAGQAARPARNFGRRLFSRLRGGACRSCN